MQTYSSSSLKLVAPYDRILDIDVMATGSTILQILLDLDDTLYSEIVIASE